MVGDSQARLDCAQAFFGVVLATKPRRLVQQPHGCPDAISRPLTPLGLLDQHNDRAGTSRHQLPGDLAEPGFAPFHHSAPKTRLGHPPTNRAGIDASGSGGLRVCTATTERLDRNILASTAPLNGLVTKLALRRCGHRP